MSDIIRNDIEQIIKSLGKETRRLEGKTILISGGAGFLGSFIIAVIDSLNKQVLGQKCKVISIDNYITGKKRKILNSLDKRYIKFINGDVTKPIKIKRKIDYVIHAAGLASPVYYQKYPVETIESAILGAKYLLEFSRLKKVKSFLYFSSSEIYGDPDRKSVPTREEYRGNVSPIGPRACYDESKRLGETLCMVYYQKFNTPTKIVRPFNIYGPGMLPNDYRVVPTFIACALRNKYLAVHDKGSQTRTFCYISDAIVAFLKVLLSEKNGEVYNVGNDDNEITIYKLAKLIVRIVGRKKVSIRRIKYPEQYPQDEPKRRCPDLTKIKSRLGYDPKVDLESGLKRVIGWYKEEGLNL